MILSITCLHRHAQNCKLKCLKWTINCPSRKYSLHLICFTGSDKYLFPSVFSQAASTADLQWNAPSHAKPFNWMTLMQTIHQTDRRLCCRSVYQTTAASVPANYCKSRMTEINENLWRTWSVALWRRFDTNTLTFAEWKWIDSPEEDLWGLTSKSLGIFCSPSPNCRVPECDRGVPRWERKCNKPGRMWRRWDGVIPTPFTSDLNEQEWDVWLADILVWTAMEIYSVQNSRMHSNSS